MDTEPVLPDSIDLLIANKRLKKINDSLQQRVDSCSRKTDRTHKIIMVILIAVVVVVLLLILCLFCKKAPTTTVNNNTEKILVVPEQAFYYGLNQPTNQYYLQPNQYHTPLVEDVPYN
jgi:flagellar basal body-associated protein FliL